MFTIELGLSKTYDIYLVEYKRDQVEYKLHVVLYVESNLSPSETYDIYIVELRAVLSIVANIAIKGKRVLLLLCHNIVRVL